VLQLSGVAAAASNAATPDRSFAMSDETGSTATSSEGLSDNAAGAIAYITIIPAIIFLVMAPYNTKPFVKFHAFQCLGLAATGFCLGIIGIIPILGWIVLLLGMLTLFVCWILCVVKASQGGAFKLPIIGKFAAEQSGYNG
jgi:uncharacterized membrane protein